MSEVPNLQDGEAVSKERRAALRAIGKYATLGAASSVVVLTSAEAVKAKQNSNGCGPSGGKPRKCD